MNQATAFGDWLKQRRRAFDLTQEQLANWVGCSHETVRKIEAGTRRPSKEMVDAFAHRLAVAPEERPALIEFARTGSRPQVLYHPSPIHHKESSSTRVPANLPHALAAFVGRHKEMESVRSLLWRADLRLLTLTGPGGSGKTRLAVQVAAGLSQDFQDGVSFVSLASITDPELVATTIAHELDIQELPGRSVQDSIQNDLRTRRILLLLDNFEQVLDAAPLVAWLLSEAPNLKILVTSREPLHLYGEHIFPVPPLQLPESVQLSSPEELGSYEAVDLFVQRARLVKPEFALTSENALAVAEICVRLDGLPLTIELAAARCNVLPPHAMAAQMESRLSLLARGPRDVPARQQTLRNAIEWSYNLLNREEARLFRRLAVFVGGCTFGAMQQVCGAGGDLKVDLLELVASLIDKSLLKQHEAAGGEPRFSMLETIHEFAREKLQESGELEDLRKAHALYFRDLAQEAEPHLRHAQQAEWLDRVEGERANFLAALRWAKVTAEARTDGQAQAAAEIGLRMAWSIWRFWEIRGYLSEGRELLAVMLSFQEAIRTQGLDKIKARVLHATGNLCYRQGDYSTARSYYQRALALDRDIGDSAGAANSLNRLGLVAFTQGDHKTARALYEESLAIYRESGERWGVAVVLNNLGNAAYVQGDYDAAYAMHMESLAIRRDMGNKSGIAWSLNNLGNVAFGRGDYDTARSLYAQSTALHNELHDTMGVAAGLSGLGAASVEAGDTALGARLLGASESLLNAAGATLELDDQVAYDQGVASARARLGDQAFEQARQEGRAKSIEEAINYALGEARGLPSIDTSGPRQGE